jgi:DNA-3-methyladenine glycosylase
VTPDLFDRASFLPSAELLAPELLGHFLLRRLGDEWVGGAIVEAEAYLVDDPASHGYARETPRNRVMYGAPGNGYVYLIYGYHHCVNVVCRPEREAEAVLIRAVEPTFGLERMCEHRPVARPRDLTNGPAKLCSAMAINLSLDGVDLCDPNSPLILARNPEREAFLAARSPVVRTTRIGLTKAADWPLRWYSGGSEFVSKRAKMTGVAALRTRLE